jgi:hypothetical protein
MLHGMPGHDLVNGRVSIGRPQVTPLNANGVERWGGEELAEHARYLTGSARFCLLSTAVNFHHHEREPVEHATLNVQLREYSSATSGHPVARDLSPLRAVHTVKRSSSLKLNVDLKFVKPEATQSVEEQNDTPYLEAEGLGRSDVLWTFTRTGRQKLTGVHSLRMVIQLPGIGACKALFALSAGIRLGRIIEHEAQMPPQMSAVDI